MVISYAILCHSETDSLRDLIEVIYQNKQEQDEIVIVADTTATDETLGILTEYKEKYNIIWEKHSLNKDFAQQKNYLNSLCNGRYIFNLDADELPPKYLMDNIHIICSENDCDLYWVPRVNTVDGLTDAHVKAWGWNVTEKGWVNFPDYQARIYKNVDYINWVRPVHEIINGSRTHTHLPQEELFSIIHHKDINTQEKQNITYGEILNEYR